MFKIFLKYFAKLNYILRPLARIAWKINKYLFLMLCYLCPFTTFFWIINSLKENNFYSEEFMLLSILGTSCCLLSFLRSKEGSVRTYLSKPIKDPESIKLLKSILRVSISTLFLSFIFKIILNELGFASDNTIIGLLAALFFPALFNIAVTLFILLFIKIEAAADAVERQNERPGMPLRRYGGLKHNGYFNSEYLKYRNRK